MMKVGIGRGGAPLTRGATSQYYDYNRPDLHLTGTILYEYLRGT